MLLVNLCIADLLMIQTLPLFLINLYHRSPYIGVTGAKVSLIQKDKITISEAYFRYMVQYLCVPPWQLSGFSLQ